jgi:outer membrane receptor for ferrienterochelin and colicin
LRAETAITGRVTNENNAPVAGARVLVSRPGGTPAESISDQAGIFSCRSLEGSAEYRLSAERAGYFRLENLRITDEESRREIHVVLTPLREVYETIDVSASAGSVGLDGASQPRSVSGAELLAVPFPASNSLKNSLRIMPGVVQDAKAGIHVNGSPEEQVLFTLDGFTLNDPLTGRLESRVGVEAVQSVEIMDGSLPAEFGRGAAGVVAVKTVPGDDAVRYTATNFFPGIETAKRVYIGNWSPRFGLSGPIRKGRAWFSDTVSIQHSKEVLPDLPDGADELTQWRFNNVLRAQINLTPSQILHAGFLFNGWWAPRTGLNQLTPLSATIDKEARQWFAHARYQAYLPSRALVEAGYAANRTYGSEMPQGTGPLRVSADGYAGNATLDATRRGSRDQWLGSVVWPGFFAAGGHQLKMGGDVSRSTFEQQASRSGIEYYSRGRMVSRVAFGGPGWLSQANLEASLFAQDGWKPRRNILIEAGTRWDEDRLSGSRAVSPRIGVAWTPGRSNQTVLRGGYAVVYEQANLRLFTRPLDQYALTTYYAEDGSPARSAATAFVMGGGPLSAPRARNWSAGIQQALNANMDLQVRYYGRRGRRGFTYVNQLAPGQPAPAGLAGGFGVSAFDAIYALGNQRRDAYDSLEVTARQTLRRQYGWLASYTRSRAASNAVLDIEIADPIRVLNNFGPMPWDSPHRFVGWAYLPLFWKNWAIASMVETRTGFPFATQSAGFLVESLNGRRFPLFFEWNQHLERRFVLRGHRWEFRAGLNNVTNHYNPNVVNANPESANFLRYYGGQRRAVNFRIRWLGRAEARAKRS